MSVAHDDDPERPVFQHPWKTTLAGSELEGRGFVFPVDWDDGTRPVFIVEIVAFVFVQREVAVSPGIDPQIDGIRLAGSRLHTRAIGNNRASPGIDRNPLQRRIRGDALPTVLALTGPEINPVGARGKVDRSLPGAFL